MRLQELKTKEAKQMGEATVKTVRVFLQNTFYSLNGTWHWEMETDAVFCSDVMVQSPDNFFGTKAIFHPDDLPAVKESLCTDEPVESLGFRIITTYGEVKQVTGEAVTVQVEEQTAEDLQKQAIEAVIAEQERKAAAKHGELVKELAEKNSRFAGLGNWYFNAATGQTWYANAVFTLHGLPPQSLNAHLHTFHPFIHPDDVVLVTDFLDKAFQERSPLQMDYRILAGETEKWISYKSDWFFNVQGEAILGGTYQDISEQKATELELEDFKNLVQWQRQQIQFDEQQVNFGHWQVNLLTRKTVYSDQYYRIFGLKPQSLTATLGTFLNYIHPEDRDEVEAAYKKMIYEHAAPELEYRVVRMDGKMRYIQQKAKLLLYEGDLIISGLIQDVTVQRMLEKKLARVQEENWVQGQVAEQASEMASLLSWSVDLEDGSITWSDSFYRFLGYSKTTPVNASEKSLFSIIHPQDVKLFKEHWTRAIREKQPATFEFRSMQRGSIYHMMAVFSLQERGEKTWFIGTVEDITGEQVLQQKLAQRVQLAESLTNNIPDRVIITDTSNTILVWNPAAEKAYGVKKTDAIGENFFDLFPALKTEEEMHLFHRVHRGEKVVVENAASVTGNGFYNLHLLPLFSGDEVSGILHIARNVTAETELRQHLNDRLHLIESLVQSSVDRIIALDAKMNYLFWNKKAEDYYGLTKEEVLGKNILEVFPQMVNDPSYQQLRKALKGETIHIPIDPSRQKYFETYLIPIKGQDGAVVSLLWTAHDLSHEWQLQEEQRRSQARLQEEHLRLKEAQAIGHVGSFEWKVGSSIAYWSDELYRINGLEPQSEEITPDKVDQFIYPDDFAELQSIKEQSMKQPGNYHFIHRIRLRDGQLRWVNHEWESFAGEAGTVERVTGIVQDITEEIQANQRIQQSEALLRSTEEVAEVGSYEADLLQNTFRFSDGMYRLFGEEPNSLEPSLEWIDSRSHPDDVAVVKDILDSAVANKHPYHYTRRIYRKDGDLRILEAHGKVVCNDAGDAVRLLGLVQDITERKQAEEALLESKLFIEQVMNATLDFIIVFNFTTNKFDYVNRSGYKGDEERYHETLQINYEQIIARAHPDDREPLHRFIEQLRRAEDNEIRTIEYRVIREQEVIWYRSRGKVFKRDGQGHPTHYISIVQDITEHKQAAEEVHKSLTILKQAEDIAAIGSWEYQIPFGRFSWSDGMYRLMDYPMGAPVQPEIYLERSIEEDRAVAKRIVKHLRKNHQSFEEYLRIKTQTGVRHLKVKGTAVSDEAGHVQRMVGVDMDMTDQIQASEQLKQSQRWLEETAKASPDAITIYDLQKKQPIYLNNCLAEWTGKSLEELVAMGIDGRLQLIHGDDRLNLLHFNERVASAKDGDVLTLEYRIFTKQGEVRWIRNRSKVFQRDAGGKVTHILSVLQEVSEEKAAERLLKSLNASLEQQNKELEAKNDEITSFAFVASHDMKEPIRKIHTFSDWLLNKETHLTEAGKQNLLRLHNSVKRLDTLVEDIVALTKVHVEKEDLHEVDLNVVLQRAKAEMHEQIERTGTEIIAAGLPTIKGVENHLVYLFKNLFSNSIKFQTPGNKPVIHIKASRLDSLLKLTFTDNGIGFSPEYNKRIFQMFRRLHGKHEYEGTGMGLAICKRIMDRHGGNITADGEAGKWATFTCWFPI